MADVLEFPKPEQPLAKVLTKALVSNAHRALAFHQAVAVHHLNEAQKIQAQLDGLGKTPPKDPA